MLWKTARKLDRLKKTNGLSVTGVELACNLCGFLALFRFVQMAFLEIVSGDLGGFFLNAFDWYESIWSDRQTGGWIQFSSICSVIVFTANPTVIESV